MSNNNGGCLSFIFPFLKLFTKENEEVKLPYAKRDDFLSYSELSFYKVLRQAIDDSIIICPKVSLKDIFFVKSKDKSDFRTYHNKIDRKHVDFLLCNSDTLEPICGVELDDSSHQKTDRVYRDRFVNEVFEVSGLALVRFKNKKSYTLNEIKEKIDMVCKNKNMNQDSANVEQCETDNENPICPKCSIPMVRRQAKQGSNKGKGFWGCPNYPKCREVK